VQENFNFLAFRCNVIKGTVTDSPWNRTIIKTYYT